MRLLIREYLEMLKESGEFDRLIPELLLAMKIAPISRAQVGVRQGGVDIAAVGKTKDGQDCLFLFVLKRGNIGRNDWDSGPTAIRQSLNEIKDTYLSNWVSPKHKDFLKKIIISTTGDIKQDTKPNLDGYIKENAVEGKLEYEIWNGDTVALLIEEHLFNEHLLSDESKSDFRKALSLIGEAEYDLSHFYKLLNRLLFQENEKPKNIIKAFRTINLIINILFHWAATSGNLKNPMLAIERSMLWGWDAIRKNQLTENKLVIGSYINLIISYARFSHVYFVKLQPHCSVRDGLSIYSSESVLITENIFEQIGILSLIGLFQLALKDFVPNLASKENAKTVADTINALIINNPCSGSPCYDSHSIEISLALVLFSEVNNQQEAKQWLQDLIYRATYTFGVGKNFPIYNDSFDDLVEFYVSPSEEKSKQLMEISTLVPTIAEWALVFNLEESYNFLISHKETFKDTCMQLWYPDETTEKFIYSGPAQYETGTSEAPIILPDDTLTFKKQIHDLTKSNQYEVLENMSFYKCGIPLLDLIASRHYRTPIHPQYWQEIISKNYENGLT